MTWVVRCWQQKVPYEAAWKAMKAFTVARDPLTRDELWLLRHHPVYTQGQAGKPEHLLNPKGIPVVQTDRGGQITYHGPGQLMLYALFDVHRLGLGTRDYVRALEQVVINTLASYGIEAAGRVDAPGVYVDEKKICSIGLRVKKGYSYHGCALNVSGDLAPFAGINPCGFSGLEMTSIADWVTDVHFDEVVKCVCQQFSHVFGLGESPEMILQDEWKYNEPEEKTV